MFSAMPKAKGKKGVATMRRSARAPSRMAEEAPPTAPEDDVSGDDRGLHRQIAELQAQSEHCATGYSDRVDLRVGRRRERTAVDVRRPGAGGALACRSDADATARSDNVARSDGKHSTPDDDADDDSR